MCMTLLRYLAFLSYLILKSLTNELNNNLCTKPFQSCNGSFTHKLPRHNNCHLCSLFFFHICFTFFNLLFNLFKLTWKDRFYLWKTSKTLIKFAVCVIHCSSQVTGLVLHNPNYRLKSCKTGMITFQTLMMTLQMWITP